MLSRKHVFYVSPKVVDRKHVFYIMALSNESDFLGLVIFLLRALPAVDAQAYRENVKQARANHTIPHSPILYPPSELKSC